jgi:hypothetical protein
VWREDLIGRDSIKVELTAIEKDLDERARTAKHAGVGYPFERNYPQDNPVLCKLPELVRIQGRLEAEREELFRLKLLWHVREDLRLAGVERKVAANGAQLLVEIHTGEFDVDICPE